MTYPFLYGVKIDTLLQDDEETLNSGSWFEHPWWIPNDKAWVAVLHLATSVENLSTRMLLTDLNAFINASIAHASLSDAKASYVLKIVEHFKSVKKVKNFLCSCLRKKVIKSVATRVDKVGKTHEHDVRKFTRVVLTTVSIIYPLKLENAEKRSFIHTYQVAPNPSLPYASTIRYTIQALLSTNQTRRHPSIDMMDNMTPINISRNYIV